MRSISRLKFTLLRIYVRVELFFKYSSILNPNHAQCNRMQHQLLYLVALSREQKNRCSSWWILLHWAGLHTFLLLHCVAFSGVFVKCLQGGKVNILIHQTLYFLICKWNLQECVLCLHHMQMSMRRILPVTLHACDSCIIMQMNTDSLVQSSTGSVCNWEELQSAVTNHWTPWSWMEIQPTSILLAMANLSQLWQSPPLQPLWVSQMS